MTLSLYAMSVTSMCRPLDGIQVDPFLVHLSERRQLAELGDLALQEIDRVVDFRLGREAAEREPDRAVRQLVGASQRAQHVRRLEARRGARRARGHRDVLDR